MPRVVCPLTSRSVVQSFWPTVCASTKTKSQSCSVSRLMSKLAVAPPAGTSISWVNRLYELFAACETANRVPVDGAIWWKRSGSIAST